MSGVNFDGEIDKKAISNVSPRRFRVHVSQCNNDLRRIFDKFVHKNARSGDISVNVSAGSLASVL